ncbi:MAG: ORF6N domain-containing protein [Candidatus Omnitrophica bacterium]|nr:ORF6N domain-containing protein [Candidatus Omnitrophota bacterium]
MNNLMIPAEKIQKVIYLIRAQKVMLDRDLAAMYGVPTKVLKQAVRRNATRFPADFMFVLTREEFADWRSQFMTSDADRAEFLRSQSVTSKTDPRGGTQYPPMVFTEQGVAMLSSVLNSERAIQVNIAIMRTFTQLRQMLLSNTELARKLADLEKRYDTQFKVVFDAIRQLMTPPDLPRKPIGFHVREPGAKYGIRRKEK